MEERRDLRGRTDVQVRLSRDASGAAEAGRRGDVVVVVDVISMSTTLEAVLAAGAAAVYGASPDDARVPEWVQASGYPGGGVRLEPEGVGRQAAARARDLGTDLVLIGEPRVGSGETRRARMQRVIRGIADFAGGLKEGKTIAGSGSRCCWSGEVLPNLGAETVKLADFAGKVVLAVTASGGTAFDAALAAGAPAVTTATIARITGCTGRQAARRGCLRALGLAQSLGAGLTFVAASRNSLEDILAAGYLYRLILSEINGKKLQYY